MNSFGKRASNIPGKLRRYHTQLVFISFPINCKDFFTLCVLESGLLSAIFCNLTLFKVFTFNISSQHNLIDWNCFSSKDRQFCHIHRWNLRRNYLFLEAIASTCRAGYVWRTFVANTTDWNIPTARCTPITVPKCIELSIHKKYTIHNLDFAPVRVAVFRSLYT